MAHILKTTISVLTSLSLVICPVVQAAVPHTMSRADYESCQAQDESAFRAAIEKVTTQALANSMERVDYGAAVRDEWRRMDMDTILDKQVDQAIEDVRNESSWGELLQSLAYSEQAQKLAVAVAERVYRSEPVKEAIENLAVGVGTQLGKEIEQANRDATTPALKCLKAFLGPRYGETIASVVTNDASADFGVEPDSVSATVTPGAVLRESTGGMTGAAILLVRRQLANLARSIGQRLVGAVLSRLVSVVAGGIGIALIAKDIWDLRHGVLPIIADEMKSDETKEKVREELANGLSGQIKKHVHEIGVSSADRMIAIWQQFRSAHAKALELAEKNSDFKNFLNTVSVERLGRLDEVVALILADEGENGILARLRDGTLNETVKKLSDPAMTIARESRSLEKALKWNAVAGSDIGRVVDYGIYRHAEPGSFTTASLKKLLALNDQVAITHMAKIPSEARSILFELDPEPLKALARSLSSSQLKTLSQYLTGLNAGARDRVLAELAKSPGKMSRLASGHVRNAVLASNDQIAAVDMMLRSDSTFDPNALFNNAKLVWDGKVSPILLLDKHPLALLGLLVALVIFIAMLRRLFVTRKPQPAETV